MLQIQNQFSVFLLFSYTNNWRIRKLFLNLNTLAVLNLLALPHYFTRTRTHTHTHTHLDLQHPFEYSNDVYNYLG